MELPARIALLRKSKKFTQEKFGELVNVSQRTVAFWESGERTPSYGTISRLADRLDTSVDFLLGRADARPETIKKEPAVSDSELKEEIIDQIRNLPGPALCRVSDFLSGLEAGREIGAASPAAPDPDPAPDP